MVRQTIKYSDVMRSAAGHQPTVPSKSLLRFLRSQSDSLCFTTAHHNPLAVRYPRLGPRRRHLSTSLSKQARLHSTHNNTHWPQYRDHQLRILPSPRHLHQCHSKLRDYNRSDNVHAERSEPRGGIWRRLFGLRGSRPPQDSADDLGDIPFNSQHYEDTSAELFNLSRALSRNPSGVDLKLRCTEFDANGNVTLVSGEFKKSELIAKYGLLPRDLRKIDSSILPHILVRSSAILVNLLHLRVLIQSDRVLVFDAFGSTDSYTQSLFMYDLEGKLRSKADPRSSAAHLPYELRALEAVLISATSGLEAEFTLVRDPVVRVLRALESDIDRDKLRHLLIHSKKLSGFEQKARLVRDAINDILEADDDLAAMYLTERNQSGKPREEENHQEVEMLLESYHKICDEIVEISGNLMSNIRNTEEVVRAILDSNRNQLMLLDLKFSIGTLGLASGTLIAGLYGMNLENFIEESNIAFGGVTGVCFGLTALVCVYGMRKLRTVQKIRMWGEGPQGFWRGQVGRGNWNSEAVEHTALTPDRVEKLRKLRAVTGGGPVLWPGIEGLGMHKLDRERNEGLGVGHLAEERRGAIVTAQADVQSRRATKEMKAAMISKRDQQVPVPTKDVNPHRVR